ncbi:MAG: M23 family metallopeptidase [Flavobacteriia bacterium]|jgi:murein DD-endopeptidase MepM/ murein hydrolase activator NlpD
MSKKKYKYNPQSLSYEEVSVSFGMRILRLMLWMAPSIIMGLVLAFLFSRRLDSPKEKMLQGEIDIYKEELVRLNADMDLVNRVLQDIEKRDEDLYRVALYADQFPKELRIMGTGGSEKYAYLNGYSNSELLKRTSERMDFLEQRLHGQSLSFKELLDLAKNKEKMLASIPAIQPVSNKNLREMASGFGYRIDPIYKTRRMHTGMDFTARTGTDVYATGDGVVEELESSGWGYGRCIVINHGYGYKTRYAHLSAFKVKRGQKVKRGELIGLVGSTGKSTGPHLHYEVEKGGKKVNPIHYYHSDLSPEQYEKLIEMSHNSFKALD